MNSIVERSRNAVPLVRKIVHELKLSNEKITKDSQQVRYVMEQLRNHKLTQRLHSKSPNEMEHLATTYATYLESSRILAALQEKHRGKPKSVEESAKLVGLQIPTRRQD
ncbi:Protein FMC1-like protein [Aphelenchoides besseyi]|nr:Protein FMC1-like protein [Aphelenchoides besseyi]